MTMDKQEWLEQLDRRFPRTPLAFLPTPLEYLGNLTKHLGGPKIYIKRDDLTGLTLGGDKPRKLEYLLGDALKHGYDTVITAGSSQSNHIRLTTAAARKVGLHPIAFTVPDEHSANTGNLFTSRLLDCELIFRKVPDNNHWHLVPFMDEKAEELRRAGRKAYVIPISGTTDVGCLGYIRCMFELEAQFNAMNVRPTVIYVTCGTGGNIASLMIGMNVLGMDIPIRGISVNRQKNEASELVMKWFNATCALIGVKATTNYDVDDRFIGQGYGKLTAACKEAILLAARTDGILLDPVYTGKTMSGLIGHIREGRLTKNDTVVVIHTGGVPALFAYADELITNPQK